MGWIRDFFIRNTAHRHTKPSSPPLFPPQPPFTPLRSGPNAPSKPTRQKQIPSSQIACLGFAGIKIREDIIYTIGEFPEGHDERKALIAHLLMERTSVPQKWIVEKLAMGSAPYVSRLAKEMGQRIAGGERAMKRMKKAIVAKFIT